MILHHLFNFLPLGVMGWDDLLYLAASAALSAGAQKAAAGSMDSSATSPGNVPALETQQQDPFAWVNEVLARRKTPKMEKLQDQTQL